MNCESLAYLTSGGISVFLQLEKEFHEKKHYLVFAGLNREISSLFTMLGLNSEMMIARNRNEAESILEKIVIPEEEKTDSSEGFRFASEGLLVEESEIVKVPLPEEKVVHYSSGNEKSNDSELVKRPAMDVIPQLQKAFSEKVIVCESCGSRLKVERAGKHQCPSCNIEFDIRNTGSISWLEKL